MNYKEIEGNIITEALNGAFDVIMHGCNCFCTQKSGLAPQMVKAFGTDAFNFENPSFEGDINKLGMIDGGAKFVKDGKLVELSDVNESTKVLIVINAYTQYTPGPDARYDALKLCLEKINDIYKGYHVGLPLIGCGIGGLVWQKEVGTHSSALWHGLYDVKDIVQDTLTDVDVTIVHFKPD
jgi:O-acetyl-ADP-ribose deacetylase (regulator of RNase III)